MGQIKISQLTPKDAPLSTTDLLIIAEETPDGYESKSVTGRDIQQSVGKFGDQFGINTDTPIHALQVESDEQCIILAKTSNTTGGGVALMDANTSDEFQVGVGAFADRLCLRSNAELFKFPTSDGTSGQAIVTDGSGNLSFASASANPRTLASVNGLNLTGTAIQISASVRIPAGTLVTNNSIYIKNLLTKTAGSTNSIPRFYINTSNSLTGATSLGSAGGMATSVYFQRFERNIFFDGTNLNCFSAGISSSTDLTSGAMLLVPFNPAIDYYLIFAVQNSTASPDNLGHKRVIVQIYD
jgi:hypothetical protein